MSVDYALRLGRESLEGLWCWKSQRREGGCRENGAMDEFVYLVYEIVKGDLVFAGGAGFFVEGQCTVFVSLF